MSSREPETGSGNRDNKSGRVIRDRKPRRCPKCKHYPLANILYGMPTFDDELEQKIKEGRIAIGGCCVSFDDPAWVCSKCGLEIYRPSMDDLLPPPHYES